MKSKLKGWIFGLIVLLILIIPIVSEYYKSKDVEVISYKEYLDLVADSTFSLVYFGNPSDEGYKDVKQSLITVRNDFDVTVKTLDTSKLKDNEKTDLIAADPAIEFDNGFVFIKDSEVVYSQEGSITNDRLEVIINKYLNNIIPEEEIVYKVAANYKAYKTLVDSKKVTMAVFGYDQCQYCAMYKPVYNDVAREYKLDIYYFNSQTFDSKEYEKIMNSGLMIPKACNNQGKDIPLSDGFGTPLTLFTKNGKVIDCISGYVGEDALVAKLKTVGLIK